MFAVPILFSVAALSAFADLDQADAQIASFVAGSGLSATAQPLDRRLHLAACPAALTLAWFGTGQRSILVTCPTSGSNWRVYVPVAGATSNAAVADAQTRPTIVQRGDEVIMVVTGDGFTISRSAEALEPGANGQWIKLRGPGGEALRARISGPGQVELVVR